MTTTLTAADIPGYRARTWTIDNAHSEVGFTARHMMISKVHGKFDKFSATFVTGENPLDSTVTASAEIASINTDEPNRDNHLRSNDFFNAAQFPTMEFVSTGVRLEDGEYKVDGLLTIRGSRSRCPSTSSSAASAPTRTVFTVPAPAREPWSTGRTSA